MRTILLTGKNGQVGWELQRTLQPLGRVVAVGRAELDLSDPDAIRRVVREIAPDIIVNSAAYTAVDKAESEPGLAQAINAVAPGVLAEEAERLGAWLVHYSTDYVFDGSKQGVYLETDEPNPLNVYGRTKLAGERAICAMGGKYLILRTSWVYGGRGQNFLLTMLRLAKERAELRIVDDQLGAPTWCRMIAEATSQLLAQCFCPLMLNPLSELSGTYHLTSSGATSWHGFAKAILENAKPERWPSIIPISTEGYPLPAVRPKNSILSNEKLKSIFGLSLPDWEIGLEACMQDMSP